MAAAVWVADIVRTLRGKSNSLGGYKLVIADLSFTNGVDEYATGGVAIAASLFGLTQLDLLLFMGDEGTTSFDWVWDPSAGKVKAYTSAATDAPHAEASASDDMSGQSMRVLALGY